MMIVHGEQYFELKRPLPTAATFTNHAHISHVYDKGSGAVLIMETSTRDDNGEEIALNRSSFFVRGIGGFGGDRGPSGKISSGLLIASKASAGSSKCWYKRCASSS